MGVFSHTSDRLGNGTTYYSVVKAWTLRRQWMLMVDNDTHSAVAAYFRDEGEARRFADTFNLTITAHPDDRQRPLEARQRPANPRPATTTPRTRKRGST